MIAPMKSKNFLRAISRLGWATESMPDESVLISRDECVINVKENASLDVLYHTVNETLSSYHPEVEAVREWTSLMEGVPESCIINGLLAKCLSKTMGTYNALKALNNFILRNF